MKPATNLLVGIPAGISVLVFFIALSSSFGGALVLALLIFVGSLIYFAPSIRAFELEHTNATAIFTLNLALGWLLIPWVIALVWSLSRDKVSEQR